MEKKYGVFETIDDVVKDVVNTIGYAQLDADERKSMAIADSARASSFAFRCLETAFNEGEITFSQYVQYLEEVTAEMTELEGLLEG